MRRERAQALVEVLVAFPVCIACAMAIVDCGVIVRDRIAVTQAATRAAEAQIAGADARAAAERALPAALQDSLDVELSDARVVVTATSGARLAQLAGRPIVHHSSVEVAR